MLSDPNLLKTSRSLAESRQISGPDSGIPDFEHLSISFKTEDALWLIASLLILPTLMAVDTFLPLHSVGPGISRSRPALMASTVEYVPNQSLRMHPS